MKSTEKLGRPPSAIPTDRQPAPLLNLISSTMKTVIKFEQANCAACEQVTRLLDRMEISHQSINAFDRPSLAVKFGIRTVPTVIVLDGDTIVRRVVGYKPNELKHLLENPDPHSHDAAKPRFSKTVPYYTDSMLGGVFTLKYVGMKNGKYLFVSTSFLNKGHIYRVEESDLDTFLLKR